MSEITISKYQLFINNFKNHFFYIANGLIYNDPSIDKNTSLALFLKSTPRLNKQLLGDYLSKPANIDILKAFVRLFNFERVSQSNKNIVINLCNISNIY